MQDAILRARLAGNWEIAGFGGGAGGGEQFGEGWGDAVGGLVQGAQAFGDVVGGDAEDQGRHGVADVVIHFGDDDGAFFGAGDGFGAVTAVNKDQNDGGAEDTDRNVVAESGGGGNFQNVEDRICSVADGKQDAGSNDCGGDGVTIEPDWQLS